MAICCGLGELPTSIVLILPLRSEIEPQRDYQHLETHIGSCFRWALVLLVGMTFPSSLFRICVRDSQELGDRGGTHADGIAVADRCHVEHRAPPRACTPGGGNQLGRGSTARLAAESSPEGDLAIGLVIAAAVPCTIASATVWTRWPVGTKRSVSWSPSVTNLACFLVTPAWVWFIIGRASKTEPFSAMALHLLLIVVLPIVVAQLLRLVPGVAEFATARKPLLSILAQGGLLSIVLLGAVHSGLQLADLKGQLAVVAWHLMWMMILVASVHLAAWFSRLSMARNRWGIHRQTRWR